MRTLMNVVFAMMLIASFAMADSVSTAVAIDFSTDAGTTLLNIPSGSGVLHSVSCKVTGTITSGPAWGINVVVDGGTNIPIPAFWFSSTNWTANMAPYGTGTGSAVGDKLTWPTHIPYSTSIVVSTVPFFSGAGTISCSTGRQ